jgi:hypothetical protein
MERDLVEVSRQPKGSSEAVEGGEEEGPFSPLSVVELPQDAEGIDRLRTFVSAMRCARARQAG